eukprot:14430404-Ditylum_brightwellii.AAC.1
MKMRFCLIPWRMRNNSKMMRFWTPEMHALNFAKLCVNGLSHKKKPWDYDALHPYFEWKPVDVIKHTMASTT